MSNTLLTLSVITREAVRLWKNSNAFIQNLDTQYDDQFAKSLAQKIGTSTPHPPAQRLHRSDGRGRLQPQDTNEQSITLVRGDPEGRRRQSSRARLSGR
jgi:hypothetical protein